MRRLALLIASALVLTGCGGSSERMGAFICESIPDEGQTFKKVTLDDYQKLLDESESLAAFHKEEYPWTYDRETGDLYEYDDFEESFVPIKDLDTSFESDYNKYWTEYSGRLSKDGSKLKIRMVNKISNALLGERVEDEDFETYDIEENTVLTEYSNQDKNTEKCMLIPTTGIDVQWLEEKSWFGTCGNSVCAVAQQ